MIDWFKALDPIVQALLAGIFTWGVTALGAALVFVTRAVNRALLDFMMGFAAGVMIAASFWSLLVPAIDMAEAQGVPPWLPATVGFMLGGLFLRPVGGRLGVALGRLGIEEPHGEHPPDAAAGQQQHRQYADNDQLHVDLGTASWAPRPSGRSDFVGRQSGGK